MPRHTVEQVLAGSLGHYWLQNDPEKVSFNTEPIAGLLSKDESGSALVAGLTANPEAKFWSDAPLTHPAYVVGKTDNGGLLLSGVKETRSSTVIGGSQASTTHYDAESIVVDVPLDELNSGLTLSVAADWHGVSRWAGVRTTSEKPTRDLEGRITSLSIQLGQIEALEIQIDAGCMIRIGSTWNVSGSEDARIISAPLRTTIESESIRSIEDHVADLVVVQDLLNVAFQGFVAASSGAVLIDPIDSGTATSVRRFWNRRLMERPAGVRSPKSMTEVPLFYLKDIGGVEGIQRWFALCRTHPRLVRPILTPFHIGSLYAESQLVELGAAIDYWRGANKQLAAWAGESFQPRAVADSIGDPFYNWIGDVEKWAKRFWYHYNGLKHYIPKCKFDSGEVHRLAISGTVLLTAVALQNAAGGNDDVCTHALGSHRWSKWGEMLRSWLESL